jgi:hypothetical protein
MLAPAVLAQDVQFSALNSSLLLPRVAYSAGGDGTIAAAVSDINGDGKLDVMVMNSCQWGDWGSCRSFIGVLLGNGDGTLQPAVIYDTGSSYATGIAIADVNNDGKPDAILTYFCGPPFCSGSLGVLLGNGDGSFRPAVTYYLAEFGSQSVAVADVNADGKPDLIVAGGADANMTAAVWVLLGEGNGTFDSAGTYLSGGIWAASVAVADINGDSHPDLLVANECVSLTHCEKGALAVLLGNGDGTFRPAVQYLSGGDHPLSLAVADFNSDGKLDVVLANNGTGHGGQGVAGVLLGDGDGTFQAAMPFSMGGYPYYWHTAVAVSDINDEGQTDLVVASGSPSSTTTTEAVIGVLLGNGNGTFQPVVTFRAGGYDSGGVAVGDLNGDRLPDVIAANPCGIACSFYVSGTSSVGVLLNNSTPRTATNATLTSSLNPSFIGQAVTFAAAITSNAGSPPNGETITFYKGSTVLGTAPLSGGMAMLTTSSLPAGIFTITATYPGDSSFAASTSPGLRQVVNATTKSATMTALASSLNPSRYGQTVTFSASVSTSGSLPPTGTVAFTWGTPYRTYTIGTAALNNGVASLTKSNLNADPYNLVATYNGDVNNLRSTSPVLNQAVLQTTSAAAITSSRNPSTVGQAVTFTAKITSPTVMPTGPVTFTAGNTVLGTAQLSGGKATLTTSSLPAGASLVTVTYNGSSNIAKNTATVMQMVH